jgi:hypothetical protein
MPDYPGAIAGTEGDVFKDGVQICESTKWTFKPMANNKKYASNCTRGYKKAVSGTHEASGTLNVMWTPWKPIYGTGVHQMMEGNFGTIGLYIDAYTFFLVPMICDSFSFEVDMDEGNPITADVDFSSNGAWTANLNPESEESHDSTYSSSPH